MIPLIIDGWFIFALMGLGFWLEPINGKHGLMDEWLTPFPLLVSGIILCGLRSII